MVYLITRFLCKLIAGTYTAPSFESDILPAVTTRAPVVAIYATSGTTPAVAVKKRVVAPLVLSAIPAFAGGTNATASSRRPQSAIVPTAGGVGVVLVPLTGRVFQSTASQPPNV